MQRFTLFAGVAVACLLLDAGIMGFKVTTCGPNRYQNVHRLACEIGVIQVTSSFFGRANSKTCAGGVPPEQVRNTQCSLPTATDLVSHMCNGKQVCELNEGSLVSNPCSETFKYIETVYTCVCTPALQHRLIVCEQNMAHLECASGEKITVVSADFGRRDNTTCSFRRPAAELQNIQCSNPTSFPGTKCNDKGNSCDFRVNKAVLGEGCDGTSQYLELVYTCGRN